jgi:hypothetical protein
LSRAYAWSRPDWGFNRLLEGEFVFEIGFAWCLMLWTYNASNVRADVVEFENQCLEREFDVP